jgi:hypothetical protein
MPDPTGLQVFDWSDVDLRRITLVALAEVSGESDCAVVTQHLSAVKAGVTAAEAALTNVAFHVVDGTTIYRLCDAPHPLDRMFYRIQPLH